MSCLQLEIHGLTNLIKFAKIRNLLNMYGPLTIEFIYIQ